MSGEMTELLMLALFVFGFLAGAVYGNLTGAASEELRWAGAAEADAVVRVGDDAYTVRRLEEWEL